MPSFNLGEKSHRRFNILTGNWVLVSAHRSQRPWQGQTESQLVEEKSTYDSECYLCPGNNRIGGVKNDQYESTFVFDNDFSALLENQDEEAYKIDDLINAHTESGRCRVICFSPRHDLTLAKMNQEQIVKVVDLWRQEYLELGRSQNINYVQIFENKGSVMGCSNPHPHGQIWAQQSIPDEPLQELSRMRSYYKTTGGSQLLIDYLNLEIELDERVVCENEDFVALIPFWATWPFEILVLPRTQIASLKELSNRQGHSFANIISQVTVRYDNLFETSFPYSSGIHQAPVNGKDYPECTLHMHFYPPLLRSAEVKKFMVGYEMLGGAQRDITPEVSAKMLRAVSDVHYLSRRTERQKDS